MSTTTAEPALLVIDTNVVLDLFVFGDASTARLQAQLHQADVRWCATAAMREELARVLCYPAIAHWLQRTGQDAGAVLARFDAHATLMQPAPEVAQRCKDPDDQKFIDLAVQQRARLLSRDKEVLRLAQRLAALGVQVVNPHKP